MRREVPSRPPRPALCNGGGMDPIFLGISVVNGIIVGGLYGAIAIGLSLIFGVMRAINFAHGSFLMVGLFIPYWLWQLFKINPYVSVLVAAPALFVLGYAIQATLIAPLYKRERAMVLEPISALMLTAGVGLIMDNVAFMIFGPDFRGVTLDSGQLREERIFEIRRVVHRTYTYDYQLIKKGDDIQEDRTLLE